MHEKTMTIGHYLQRQRESEKMSLESVSKGTRINPAFLQALEEDAFQLIPSETYVRGFLQSYAKFIHLDPAEILGLYRKQVEPPKGQVRAKEGNPSPLKVNKNHLSLFLATIFRGVPAYSISKSVIDYLYLCWFGRKRSSPDLS
jgi:cytoskeleton protein RodZ